MATIRVLHPNRPARRPSRFTTALLYAASALLAACGGGGGSTSYSAPPAAATGSVAGGVVDASTGAAVAGAQVSQGSNATMTASDGRFTLNAIAPSNRVVLRLTASRYAEHYHVTQVSANRTTSVSTQMVPLAASSTVDIGTGGTVAAPGSSGEVAIPGGALSGTGSAQVSVTPINATLNPGFLPGDFTSGNGTQPLETYGAIVVTVTDGSGTGIPVATGGLITIRIPVSSRATALPATLPLYYFDPATAHWVREGSATLGGSVPNQYYEAQVSHAGTWSVDQPYETVNLAGCVADSQGARVAGAHVTADGIDYSGSNTADTDASGNYTLPIKKDAKVAVTARLGGQTSNSITAGPSASDLSTGSSCLVLTDQATNVTIKLTWGEKPSDVDSHLLTPSSDHIFFSNKGSLTAAPWANLDVDDLSSYGPEITTLRKLQVGTYMFAVNNFSGTSSPGLTDSPTRVELNISGQSTIYTPPPGEGAAMWWTVFTFSVDAACRITVTPVNTWSVSPPTIPPAPASVTYCSAP